MHKFSYTCNYAPAIRRMVERAYSVSHLSIRPSPSVSEMVLAVSVKVFQALAICV